MKYQQIVRVGGGNGRFDIELEKLMKKFKVYQIWAMLIPKE